MCSSDLAHLDLMYTAGLRAHLLTAQRAAPLLTGTGGGLFVLTTWAVGACYHGHLYYDVIKTAINRIPVGLAAELAPAGVTGRAQYGPLVHAKTALAVCANYLPVARAARLVAALTGVSVSAGFAAGIRGKAAARLGPFMDRVRELLPAARVLYADETPARAAGHLEYVHVACTGYLTAMHTGAGRR